VGYTIPATVVEDSSDAVVLFQAPGTIYKKRAGQRGGPRGRNLVSWDGTYVDTVWRGPGVLRLHVPGTAHSVLRSWNDEGQRADAWYVNLEAPWTRTAIGFDSRDHVLDVEVAPDLSSWSWKDEDELRWSVDHGKISSDDAARVRAEGERVIDAIERRVWPFVDEWDVWAPDSSWPIPVLPRGWAIA
jgi:hypothetical protein